MSNCRRLVRLEAEANRLGKIVFPDGQISDDLFVPFAHQTICSSETICSSSSVKTAIWRRCFFLDGGKPEYSEKNPRNQEQTQATYGMAPGRNRTQATLVGVTPYNSQNVLICEVYWLQGCALLIYRYNSYGVPS